MVWVLKGVFGWFGKEVERVLTNGIVRLWVDGRKRREKKQKLTTKVWLALYLGLDGMIKHGERAKTPSGKEKKRSPPTTIMQTRTPLSIPPLKRRNRGQGLLLVDSTLDSG